MNRTHLLIGIAASLALSMGAQAATSCSIHPAAGTADHALSAMAKITRTQAEKVALQAVTAPGEKRVQSGELEAENGCLIWSFDIAIGGSKITHEVTIDAGNAAVLSATTETPKQEADEAKSENVQR